MSNKNLEEFKSRDSFFVMLAVSLLVIPVWGFFILGLLFAVLFPFWLLTIIVMPMVNWFLNQVFFRNRTDTY